MTDDRSEQTPKEPDGVAGDPTTVPVPHAEAAPGTSEETEKWEPPSTPPGSTAADDT